MDKNNNYVNFNLDDLQGFGANEELTAFDYTRYINIIKKRKWWVAAITIIVATLWVAQDYYFHEAKYTTTAIIQFTRAEKQNPVENFDNIKVEGRVEILKTKNFLGRVADSLHLNFKVKYPNNFRSKIFKEISIDEGAPFGSYRITRSGDQFNLYRVKKDEDGNEITNLLIKQDIEKGGSTHFENQGFRLTFRNSILEKHKKIEFSYVPVKSAIGSLKANLRPELDESETILYIRNKHSDPYLCTDITNAMAKLFIRYISEFSHLHTDAMIVSLSKQLQSARRELDASEKILKNFRERNPYVYVERKGERSIKQATGVEDNLLELERNLTFIKGLIEKRDQIKDFEEANFVYQEILSFLDAERVPGASIFSLQYLNFINERQTLLDQLLPPQNLEVVKITQKIENLRKQIDQRTQRYIADSQKRKEEYAQQLGVEQRNLKALPKTELKFAELQRDHDIRAKIVQDIMEKYNEAKISQSTILPEATLIDEAERPRISANTISAKTILTGLLLGLIMGVGLFVGMEVFDHTIKSPKEIKDNLKLPVLITVPWIDKEKLKAEAAGSVNGNGNGEFDANLITKDYAPTLENEVFRRLRVKLTTTDSHQQLTIPVTSLNPNEGKSFVSSNLAITFSQQKRLTLLIDGDIRRGVLHSSFGCKKTPGLSDFLLSNCTVDAENIAKIIQKTYIPNLFMITVGKPAPNPLEILSSPRMEALYLFLKDNFSTIIIDTPPFGLVPDVFVLKRFINEVLLVTRFETTNMNHLKDGLNDFDENEMSIKGVVFNASEIEHRRYGKYYKYSYYNY